MKHTRYNFLFAIAALILPFSVSSAVSVENVMAKQRYPWNGLVDISYTVSGEIPVTLLPQASLKVTAKDCDTGTSYTAATLSGETLLSVGTHSIVWDAANDLGEVRFTNMVVSVVVVINRNKVQLWNGGPYWATENIGADSPVEYGLYFWWGDTIGYRREESAWVASDGSSQNFSFSIDNVPTWRKDYATLKSEGWITEDGVLVPEHDAAQAHWGGSWRMPTKAEFNALLDNCDLTLTTTNGVRGYVVRGRDDFSDNSIFLPGCGGANGGTALNYAGSNGYYWSSVPSDNNEMYSFVFYFDSGTRKTEWSSRYYGRCVRPVQGFAE